MPVKTKPKQEPLPTEPKPFKKMRLKVDKQEYMNGFRKGIYDFNHRVREDQNPMPTNSPQWHGWWKGWLEERWKRETLDPHGTPEAREPLLSCRDCGCKTAHIEARHRRFNTGRCAECNGELVDFHKLPAPANATEE